MTAPVKRALVRRTDEKAIEFGEIAFEGNFGNASEAAIISGLTWQAMGQREIGDFEIEIEGKVVLRSVATG